MRKAIILFVAMLFATTAVMSQTTVVKFTAKMEGAGYHAFDSVKVTSESEGWSQTLVYPDTVLSLSANVGIDEVASVESGLSHNYPNPFMGTTTAMLHLNEAETVSMQLVGMNGSVLAEYSQHLAAGDHEVNVAVAEPQVAFLGVVTSQGRYAMKMMNVGRNGHNSITVNSSLLQSPMAKAQGVGRFHVGDQMNYVAYGKQNGQVVASRAISKAQNGNETIVLEFRDPNNHETFPGHWAMMFEDGAMVHMTVTFSATLTALAQLAGYTLPNLDDDMSMGGLPITLLIEQDATDENLMHLTGQIIMQLSQEGDPVNFDFVTTGTLTATGLVIEPANISNQFEVPLMDPMSANITMTGTVTFVQPTEFPEDGLLTVVIASLDLSGTDANGMIETLEISGTQLPASGSIDE